MATQGYTWNAPISIIPLSHGSPKLGQTQPGWLVHVKGVFAMLWTETDLARRTSHQHLHFLMCLSYNNWTKLQKRKHKQNYYLAKHTRLSPSFSLLLSTGVHLVTHRVNYLATPPTCTHTHTHTPAHFRLLAVRMVLYKCSWSALMWVPGRQGGGEAIYTWPRQRIQRKLVHSWSVSKSTDPSLPEDTPTHPLQTMPLSRGTMHRWAST